MASTTEEKPPTATDAPAPAPAAADAVKAEESQPPADAKTEEPAPQTDVNVEEPTPPADVKEEEPPPRAGGPRRTDRSNSESQPTSSEPDRPRGPLNEDYKFFLANLPPSVTALEMRRHFEVRVNVFLFVFSTLVKFPPFRFIQIKSYFISPRVGCF